MKTNANAPPVAETAAPFHVELTQLAAASPLFHALHGAVPAAPVPHLPSKLEDEILHPPSKP